MKQYKIMVRMPDGFYSWTTVYATSPYDATRLVEAQYGFGSAVSAPTAL